MEKGKQAEDKTGYSILEIQDSKVSVILPPEPYGKNK